VTTTTEPTSAITAGPARPTEAEPAVSPEAFVRWGVGSYLGVVAVVVTVILVRLRGDLAYVLDDAAIHLSVADHLVRDGTWGVTAGSFESASSSPLWTLLMTVGVLGGPAVRDWTPLVLNVLAGLGVIVVLGRNQAVLRPDRRRPLDAVATAVLVVVVLFLPGLAVVGMEHTLHVLLVLAAVVLVHRRAEGRPDGLPGWAPLAVVALASLARFETAFVALGLAVGLVLAERSAAGLRRAAELLAASAVPITAFGVLNRAMGGGWLPNSIVAKGQGAGATNQRDGIGPIDIVNRLTQDPILAALFVVGVAYVALMWGREAPNRLPAVTLVVATAAHAAFADVGWYDRYQAYLIAVGVYLLLGVLAELPPEVRRRALVVAVGLAVVFGLTKLNGIVKAPRAADDMYRHQYQAARFLDRYYDDASIATDQLGYISLLHDGPLTDLGGLGDYEVLREGAADADLWADLAERREFRVVALFSSSALRVPGDWVLAGHLQIDGKTTTSVTNRLQLYATSADELEPLQDRLAEFEPDLPARVHLEINENAGLQVWAQQVREAEADAEG
jgi:hypothetical protein